jgi:hypothetical protein
MEPIIAVAAPAARAFREVAGELDPAIGDDRHAARLGGVRAGFDGGQLRHADARDDARGADRARADADFHGVSARVDQRFRGFPGGDVAGNDLHGIGNLLGARDSLCHRLGVSMRRVDDDRVRARLDQRGGTLKARVADRRGSSNTQATCSVLRGIRVHRGLVHVFHGQEAEALIVLVDDNEAFDPVLVQQAAGLFRRGLHFHRDDVARHQVRDLLVHVFGKTGVAVRDDTDDLAIVLNHRNARETSALLEFVQLTQCRCGRDGDGVHHDAALVFLDHGNFTGLLLDRQVTVNDANAAGLCHSDGEARLGHCVHGRRDKRNVQRNGFRQEGRDVDVGGKNLARAGLKKHVVKGDRLSDFHVGSSLFGPIRESRGLVKPLLHFHFSEPFSPMTRAAAPAIAELVTNENNCSGRSAC